MIDGGSAHPSVTPGVTPQVTPAVTPRCDAYGPHAFVMSLVVGDPARRTREGGSAVLEILAVIAIVIYVIGRQLVGEPLRGKRLILLPAVLAVVGLFRLVQHGTPVGVSDIALLTISAVIAAAIGAGQGSMMRLESREGALWGRMPPRALWLWAALIGCRVATMVLASAMGAHVAASSAPIVMLLGVNRLGQAAVITVRALRAGIPFAPEKDGSTFLSARLATVSDSLTGAAARTSRRSPGAERPMEERRGRRW